MLRILFISPLFLTISIAYSQESKLTKPHEINSSKTEISTTESTVIENSATKTYLIKNEEYYNKFIAALKGKKEHMKSDADFNKKAESLNWYTKIDSEIEKAEQQLLKLKKK